MTFRKRIVLPSVTALLGVILSIPSLYTTYWVVAEWTPDNNVIGLAYLSVSATAGGVLIGVGLAQLYAMKHKR